MDKHLKLLVLFFTIALASTALVLYLNNSQSTSNPVSFIPQNLPITTKAALQTSVVEAPDGSHSLTMKEEKTKNTTTYTFSISTKDSSSQKTIFTKTLEQGSSFSVPPNTFSPDDKYVFLKETTQDKVNYLVLTSSGDPITKDSQTITFSDLFATKLPEYKITDVTGWAAPGLIIINTDKLDGNTGPSFWFEVPTQSFIRLSNRFN